jgi:queuine/archaeosine tRNA-ribosyltransferase
VTYYQRLVAAAREAILADRFGEFREEKYRGWGIDPRAGEVPMPAPE